ncbi:hypothetical protein AAFF_G00066700 [Aldrovandia affinis]|uniref:Deacetylase sirtuin-type domain-containing protein n=1 Tax=Aldrovandia affinis TaxID=143900 RepID=A0AAD7WYP0_9TELE|nr:hypothetical protein AAFF_G00066700 [Aldrovandia affinis]
MMRLSWRSPLWPVVPRRHRSLAPASALDFIPPSGPVASQALEQLQRFVRRAKRLFVITGAGLSTESGIPDYRSEGVGLYARTERRPVQHAEFLHSARARQRYWARNYVGWPRFSSRLPNSAHLTLRSWEAVGKVHWLVTQNVDALHSKAGQQRLTELHGCAHRVVCLGCGSLVCPGDTAGPLHSDEPWVGGGGGGGGPGPGWGRLPLRRAVSRETVHLVMQRLAESDRVLVAGSSLQVYSGYRFLLAASEGRIPVAIVNIGPTRADHLSSLRVSGRCGEVLTAIGPL